MDWSSMIRALAQELDILYKAHIQNDSPTFSQKITQKLLTLETILSEKYKNPYVRQKPNFSFIVSSPLPICP